MNEPNARQRRLDRLFDREDTAVRSASRGTAEREIDRLREETRRHDSLYRRSLAVSDLLAALGALAIGGSVVDHHSLRWPVMLMMIGVVVVAKVAGLYDHDNLVLRRSSLEEVPALFNASALLALCAWLLAGALFSGPVTRGAVLAVWGAFLALSVSGRVAARVTIRRISRSERCMLLGNPEVWDKLKTSLDVRTGASLVAYFPLRTRDGGRWQPLDAQLAAARVRLAESLARERVHRVIIAMDGDRIDDTVEAILFLGSLGTKVSVIPHIPEVLGSAGDLEDVDGMPVLGIRNFGISRSSRLIKRSFDVLVSGAALALLGPLLAAAAIAIRLDTPGPVFFRQRRVGRNGAEFSMLKFRTMVDGADAQREALAAHNETRGLFKLTDDPRVTRVGRRLRRSSLDELPQLLNVLRGEMSVVGPRPLIPEEDRRVRGWARRRLDLTPGMTGPWQVLASTRVPLEEMVKIDYLYIANWSLWSDVMAIVKTVPHVLGRRGL